MQPESLRAEMLLARIEETGRAITESPDNVTDAFLVILIEREIDRTTERRSQWPC